MRNKCSYFPSISSTPSPTTLYSRTTPNPVIPRSHIHTHTHTHTAFIYINYTRTCTFLPLLFFFFLSGIMRVYYIIHIHIFTFIYTLIQYTHIDDQMHYLFTYVAHRIMNFFLSILNNCML